MWFCTFTNLFCLLILLKRRVLKSPAITVSFPIYPFQSYQFYYMYSEALLSVAYIVNVAMTSWWIYSFICNYLYLSLILFLVLKFTVSYINMFTLALFGLEFAWYIAFFILSSSWFSYLMWVSYKQHVVFIILIIYVLY